MTVLAEVICSSTDRAEWLAARRSGIGSSDAPAILGISPFRSALAVYADKIGLTEDDEEAEYMKWGRILEPHIISEFAVESKRRAWTDGALMRSVLTPWLMSTCDGEQASDDRDSQGTVEVKATAWRIGDWTEGIPAHVNVQMQHQFAVTGKTWGSVVVLQGGCRLLWADIERDDRFIDEVLLPAERDFWERVQNREPVAPDGSSSASEALRAMYPEQVPGKFIHLPAESVDLDSELEQLKMELKHREKRAEEIKQTLKLQLADSDLGELPNGVQYSYRSQSRKGHVVAPSTFRVLRRHASKEDVF